MAHTNNNLTTSFANWFIDTPTITSSHSILPETTVDAWVTYYPSTIRGELDCFFNRFWNEKDSPLVSDGSSLPRTNAYETKNGMTVESLIPFASKDDINITLDPVMNSIKIEVGSHQGDDEGKTFHLREISRTSFKRTFIFDKKFDVQNAVADYRDSVLNIEIPINKESVKKTLTIK